MAKPVPTGAQRVPVVLSIALVLLFAGSAVTAQEAPVLAPPATPTPATGEVPTPTTGEAPTPEGGLSLDLDVIAKQLDIARY